MTVLVMGFMHLLLLALMVTALSGCGQSSYEMIHADSSDSTIAESEAAAVRTSSDETDIRNDTKQTATICVYVCGAVHAPGVYELTGEARVYQAIEAAGGLTDEADDRHLNQAAELSDGEQITVYTKEEAKTLAKEGEQYAGEAPSQGGTADPSKVNINTADAAQLQTLKGIGASRAEDIIAYRDANGPFQAIEDIMKVNGIKQSLFGKIKDSITVS